MKLFFWAAMMVGWTGAVAEPDHIFRSGEQPVPLIELFTSEGCSSCPPAENWLSELRHDDGLWEDFVPLAWHVNYWDRLGWPDKFADQRYTDRQYAYAEHWKARNVYTPGLVRGGDEWRIRDGGMKQPGSARGGELVAEVSGSQLKIMYSSVGDKTGKLLVNVVRLGGGIASNVHSGENRGKKLAHEFLVLGWSQGRLNAGQAQLLLPEIDKTVNAPRRAIAVWISRGDAPTPIQATGGWLSFE